MNNPSLFTLMPKYINNFRPTLSAVSFVSLYIANVRHLDEYDNNKEVVQEDYGA